MLNLVQDNITPEDNNKSSVIKTPTIICFSYGLEKHGQRRSCAKRLCREKKIIKTIWQQK